MSDFAQTVKQQSDIVRVIGEYITLKKEPARRIIPACAPSMGEKTTIVFRACDAAVLPLLRLRGFGRCLQVRAGDREGQLPGGDKDRRAKVRIALPKREFSSPEEAAESRLRGRLLELYEQATLWFEEQLKSPEGARAAST